MLVAFFRNRFACLQPLAEEVISWALELIFYNNLLSLLLDCNFCVPLHQLRRSAYRECHVLPRFSVRREDLRILGLKRLDFSWTRTDTSEFIYFFKVFPSRQDTEQILDFAASFDCLQHSKLHTYGPIKRVFQLI